MRIIKAEYVKPRAIEGKVIERRCAIRPLDSGTKPEEGSHYNLTANNSIKNRPIKKSGRDTPKRDTTDTS